MFEQLNTKEDEMESFDLAAIQKRRKEALNQGKNWTLTANELRSACQLGEREFQCVEFVGVDLQYANFQGSDFQGSKFQGSNLEGANLSGANLRGANLRGANLWGANFEGGTLWGADLRSANLRLASLRGAYLQSANFEGANLLSANLRGANLQGANLWGANLWGANLQDADLRLTNLAIANSKRADIANARAALGSIRISGMSPDSNTLDAGINARGELIFWSEFQHAITPTELRAEIAQKYGDSAVGSFYLMAIAVFEMALAERQRLSDLGG